MMPSSVNETESLASGDNGGRSVTVNFHIAQRRAFYWRAALLAVAAASICALIGAVVPLATQVADLPGPLLPRDASGATAAQLDRSAWTYALYAFVAPAVVALSYVGTGAIIAWRQPGQRGPLLFSVLLIAFGDAFAIGSLAPDRVHSSVLAYFLVNSSFVGLAVSLYLFPDGRLVPRWTRWTTVVWLYVAVASAWSTGSVFDPTAWSGAVQPIFWLSLIATCPIAQVYRYRNVSGPIQRQQTKLVALGLSVVVLALMLYTARIPARPGLVAWRQLLLGLLLMASLLLIPLTIGIAMLRYRLWDVDVLINRTLVYGSLTLTLGALYVAGVVGLEALFRAVTGQRSDLAIAIVTLGVAALFNPWRHRVQAFIDRQFYRRRYDAAHTLAAFQSQLRDEVDLDQLTADVVAVVQETMEPARVSLWLR